MELVVLSLIGLGTYYLSQERHSAPINGEKELASRVSTQHKDNREAGIFWGNQRGGEQNTVNLNNAHKPFSAPTQTPTHSIDAITKDQAIRSAFIQTYAPDFYFRNNIEIPYTSAAAGVYSGVELPGRNSIQGDPGASLAQKPRTYINPEPSLNAGDRGTTGAMGSSESEVWNEEYVPPTGQLNYNMNPYGPGGAYQTIYNERDERISIQKGVNRSVLLN